MHEKKLAVVAVSGGLDSCVTAAIANENYKLALTHINYGQLTEERELKAFHEIADYYEAEKKLAEKLAEEERIAQEKARLEQAARIAAQQKAAEEARLAAEAAEASSKKSKAS